jgi:hypothetical protein
VYRGGVLQTTQSRESMHMKTVDVTEDQQPVSEFLRNLGPVRQPIQLVLEGEVVARLVSPHEISDTEKERILQEGWKAVQKARARNRGVSEREIGKAVAAAVRRVRSRK